MIHEEIIRMAREAGLYVGENASGVMLVGSTYQKFYNSGILVHMDVEDMARFAALVAADEREQCAKVCDAEADEFGGMSDGFYASKNCAEAIRARGSDV